MTDEKRDENRTSDGHLTVRALMDGEVDSTGWKRGRDVHMARLQLFRKKPKPPLFSVHHRIIHHPDEGESSVEDHRELFDDIRAARRHYELLRRKAPSTYDETENDHAEPQ